MGTRGFASDNNAGIHPAVLRAIEAANVGHAVAYGDDPYTRRAVRKFKDLLGDDAEVFFVYGGTGANVLAIRSVVQSFEAVVCAQSAHVNVDECGAPENFAGCKLLEIATPDGKLTPKLLEGHLHRGRGEHHVRARVVSITQASEMGTVYTIGEVKAIARAVHRKGLVLHMDGARIANAAASLGVSLRAATRDCGVDVLSFGGAKNGMMVGEAVVFFRPDLAEDFRFVRKQGMQLASKMRFISTQFEAMLTDDLWLRNARHANAMARLLAKQAGNVRGVRIVHPVGANIVLAALPPRSIPKLLRKYFFYVWDQERSIVRWVASFDTQESDVERLVKSLGDAVR